MLESLDGKPLQVLDIAILLLGVLVLAVSFTRANRGAGVAAALSLPPPPVNRLEPVDLVAGLAATFLLPGLVMQAGVVLGWLDSPETLAASAPAEKLPNTAQTACLTIGQCLSVAVLLFIGSRCFLGGTRGWGLRFTNARTWIGGALLGYLAVTPLCAGTLELCTRLLASVAPSYHPPQHVSIRLLQEGGQPLLLSALTLFNAFILAPVVEELLFRGILMPIFARWTGGTWSAILLSSVLFGITHLPYLDTVPALIVFGIVLGWLYARTGSLTLVIVLHAIFNGKTLLWLMLGAR